VEIKKISNGNNMNSIIEAQIELKEQQEKLTYIWLNFPKIRKASVKFSLDNDTIIETSK